MVLTTDLNNGAIGVEIDICAPCVMVIGFFKNQENKVVRLKASQLKTATSAVFNYRQYAARGLVLEHRCFSGEYWIYFAGNGSEPVKVSRVGLLKALRNCKDKLKEV